MTKQSAEIKEDSKNSKTQPQPLPQSESQPQSLPKAIQPVAKKIATSEFSISAALNKTEEQTPDLFTEKTEADLPEHHFTEKDLQTEWQNFLNDMLIKDDVVYYAVNTLKLHKTDENIVQVLYPSDSARTEFEKIQGDFFNHFKRKVNNYKIQITYKNDAGLKKEILTKRMIFEKMVEINPVLKELDDLLNFDLS